MFTFNHPSFFLLFFIFPIFFVLKKLKIISIPYFNLNLIHWNGLPPKKSILLYLMQILYKILLYMSISFLIIALTEPTTFQMHQVYTDSGSSIMFLIDISPSMAAQDINGETRLESAKKIIHKFVSKYQGDSFGLTALASSAALIVPPTIDHKVFLSRLNSLNIGELGDGTAIGMGIAVSALYTSKNSTNSSYVILLTDGENNTGEIHPKTAAEILINKNIGFYVIGIGNSGYANIEYIDKRSGKIYSGSLFSKFNEEELKNIADYGRGKYASAHSMEMLEQIFHAISKQVPAAQANFTQVHEKDIYIYFLYGVFFCFILMWILKRMFLGVTL